MTAVKIKPYLGLAFLGCPTLLRCDKGSENSLLSTCHMAMRHKHRDSFSGENSFRYGSSTTNTVSELIIIIDSSHALTLFTIMYVRIHVIANRKLVVSTAIFCHGLVDQPFQRHGSTRSV